MKIFSWNVNGIRAIERKGAWNEVVKQDADFVCLQEIKAEKEQLSSDLQTPEGYLGYFHSSQERKGYAGSAIYSRWEPNEVIYGLPESPELDRHGRTLTLVFDEYAIVTAYMPNGKSKTANLEYKLAYYQAFLKHVNKLRDSVGKVVISGDFNVAHHPIDLARPEANVKNSGFLPIERAWLDQCLEDGWIDTWRSTYPDLAEVYTYWDQKTRARDRNVGWRIDYYMVSRDTYECVTGIETLTDFVGSDHCPLVLHVELVD